MAQYHKIQTVFLRSPESNYKRLMEGHWAFPEFELLKDITWMWTEKIDGTNIRIYWDGTSVRFSGKTDNAQMPAHLLKMLQDTFTIERMREIFPEPNEEVCLYGEGYGFKIQHGGNYLGKDVGFILFDIKIGRWWLTRETLEKLAGQLDIPIVPIIGHGTLQEAVEFTRKGFKSTIAQNKDYDAEGLIMKPAVELLSRNGGRVISKIKHIDFD